MVNGIGEDKNIFLVNAPAGSGKTTWIRKKVVTCLREKKNDNILCITYTNRAAEELGRDIDSERVFFGTIHSFISSFFGCFFKHKEIVDLYKEVFEQKISLSILWDLMSRTWLLHKVITTKLTRLWLSVNINNCRIRGYL